MPVVSSKINQEELEAVAEYANRHGITVSNLIRMLLVREVAAPRVLTNIAMENSTPDNADEIVVERPKMKTLLERIREQHRLHHRHDDRAKSPTALELLARKRKSAS